MNDGGLRYWLFLLILLSPLPAFAGLDWLPALPRAVLVAQQQGDVERQYPLSPPQRIGGQLRMESSLLVAGPLQQQDWELPAGHTAAAAFAMARTSLLAQPQARLLYWCEGRECGASSLWAHQVFGNPRLLAPDDQQAALLVQLGEQQLAALYVVTRGNRRVWLHAEQMLAGSLVDGLTAGPDSLLRQLREFGVLEWPGVLADMADPRLDLLARLLQRDNGLRLRLVGSQAQLWHDGLLARGVRAAQLELKMQAGQPAGLRIEWLH